MGGTPFPSLMRVLLLAALLAPTAAAQTTFTVTTTNPSGTGSLLQAIFDANNQRNGSAPDTIAFAIPGDGPHTIRPSSELPALIEAVVIDGLTQPGADCSTWPATLMIELDGRNAGSSSDGLVFEIGGGSTVRGLVINRFGDDGIDVEGEGGNTFECNYVGTDVAGLVARPNQDDGITIESFDNVVGGASPSARNVLSGNGQDGIELDAFDFEAGRNTVQGNYIGVAADGVSPLGNGDDGVEADDGATDTLVGGTGPGEGNVIAYNGDNGVQVDGASSVRNAVLGNAIFGNTDRGIELQETTGGGQTPNDPGDGDDGPNGFQNYPVLDAATTFANTGTTTVEGTLDSAPNATFRVELFASEVLDADGFGEGEVFVGAVDVTTDAGGDAAFSVELAEPVEADLFLTATATDADGNTSEFGEGIEVDFLDNVSAEDGPGSALALALAPNPATADVAVSFDLAQTGAVEVAVVDLLGRVVRRFSGARAAGPHGVRVPLGGLPAGLYVVRVSTAEATAALPLTVAR